MNAEIISIGDELTSGERLDTNSQWLSQRLGELGVRVLFHTTVADDLAANVAVFRAACERADIVITTGGLGPTADDLTREALAATAGVELLLNPDALQQIRALFARRQRPMPARNEGQALFPAGSRIIENPHGSAPGIDFEIARHGGSGTGRVFALPGVPAEMREMWQQTVEPRIQAALGDRRQVICRRQINCFGVGESDLEQMLPDLIRRGRSPTVGITVSQATITLRITAAGATAKECQSLIEPTAATIYQCLGELVFGEGEDQLQDVVVRRLAERGQTLSLVEFGTGGLIANWLSEADREGTVFVGGRIVRGAVDGTEGTARTNGTNVSAALSALASDARAAADSDFCLLVGPFPNADSPNSAASPGQIVYAVADRDRVHVSQLTFAGHPDVLKSRAAKQALNLLRLVLSS